MNAALISIITEWLSDLKMGYCYDGWWLNQQFCCWEIEYEDEAGCDSWHPWSDVVLAQWIIYVMFAVSVTSPPRAEHQFTLLQAAFSFTAAHLVKNIAKYAAGSGISEIKCILAGFIMKGFLGFWTLAIKSLTLVSLYLMLRSPSFPHGTQPLVIASGLSVGKEGPSVHVACCVGSVVAGLFARFSQSHGG